MIKVEFPYRPLLEDLTTTVNEDGLDPYEGYAWLWEHQTELGLDPKVYCSTSITSGGHARDESLGIREVILHNTTSARLLADQLARDRQIDPLATIEPVFVGKTHWTQAQYMEFWLSVIGGFQLTPGFVSRDIKHLRQSTTQAFESIGLDMELMSGKAPATERAPEYFKMSTAFANLIRQGMDARRIGTVVRMIDTELSLGAQTERVFARQIGSKVMNICTVTVSPATVEDLATVNRELADDTERLIRFGATVFDTVDRSVQLLLTEDAAR
jgi:hypothetical protein